VPGLADPDKPGTVTIRMHVRDVVPGGHGEVNTGSNTAPLRGMPCHPAVEMRVRLARAERRHPGAGRWPGTGRPPGKGHGVKKRQQASTEALNKHAEDVALAGKFDELFEDAQQAEIKLREAQARRAPLIEQRPLAVALDSALTAVMRAAYAAQRAEIGPLGYDDRIYRRKAMARPAVHALTGEAERLLTLRENHRLNGIPPRPFEPAV
jgi:hypothetical protein